MSEIVLNAKVRETKGKRVKVLRQDGRIPAVVYGAGITATPVELDALETTRILEGVGASTLIELNVGKEKYQVLVREIQRDKIRLDILHIDFLNLAMDVVTRTVVPVELIGESPAAKNLGGLLVSGLSEIEVEALPSDLPDRITADVSMIENMDDVITVSDLAFAESVEVLTSPDEVIASVVYQEEEELEEEEVLEEIFPEDVEPELVERGRREGEEEEEAQDED
jgi:large subunit ribosomal protein L25